MKTVLDYTFDRIDICHCTPRHSPRLMVVETHHILPLSWGGADVDANKVRLCPNTHYGVHALLNEYIHRNSTPPPTVLTLYTRPVQLVAAFAWGHRLPNHPTPYWLPAHPPQTPGDGLERDVAKMMGWTTP